MTMRFIPQTSIVLADHTLRFLFAWLDFMRQTSPTGPAWTIPRSSDGSTGGAGDNIAAFGDLTFWVAATSISWFVLRSPDGLKEFLFARYNATDSNWQIRYSPAALFIGGDITVIPTATDEVLFAQLALTLAVDSVLHMGADDATPYGWFMYCNANGDFNDSRGAMAWIPITDSVQPGDIDPYVFSVGTSTVNPFEVGNMTLETVSTVIARCAGIPPGQAAQRTLPALTLRSAFGNMLPSNAPADDNSDDIGMPIPFGVRSPLSAPQGFKGWSSFALWNGVARAAGETFATRTRVSWGDVNFLWDGSVPLDT